jgi:predicted alpha/beta-fold hydrolase
MGNTARILPAQHRKAFEECDAPPIPKDDRNVLLKERFGILRDYVTSITALVFGFAYPLEHYATAGSERFVSHVCISFLGINAAEVPLFAPDTLLLGDVYTNPWILIVRTR